MSYNSNVTFWNLIECDPGFRGENCSKTCPDGYYGRKCIEKCNCNSDTQFCHHVCGCLQRSKTTDYITTNNTKVVSSYTVETCFSSADTSTDSTGWDEKKLLLLQICFLSRRSVERWCQTLLFQEFAIILN